MPHMLIGGVITRYLIEGVYADTDFLVGYVDSVILPALGA